MEKIDKFDKYKLQILAYIVYFIGFIFDSRFGNGNFGGIISSILGIKLVKKCKNENKKVRRRMKIRKYDRIYRICPKKINIGTSKLHIVDPPKKKKCLDEEEVERLLNGNIVIEEKIDGGIVGITWDGEKHLAIGKHSMIDPTDNSKKFHGLNTWIYSNYEKIKNIPLGWIVYGEWLRARHNISYDQLKDFFYAFDVWNGHKYLDYHHKSEFIHRLGFAEVPFIKNGNNIDIIEILKIANGISISNRSRLSTTEIIEGIVIKNYKKELMGKYVIREFPGYDWLKLPLLENSIDRQTEMEKVQVL